MYVLIKHVTTLSLCRYAHSGMLAAAKWLLETEAQTLIDVLHANPVSVHNYSQDCIFLQVGMVLRRELYRCVQSWYPATCNTSAKQIDFFSLTFVSALLL